MNETIYHPIPLPEFPALDGDADCDTLVIGGGLCGLMCAYSLQKAGLDVLLCEADRIAGGTTARSTAVVTVGQPQLCRDLSLHHGSETAELVMQARLEAVEAYKRLCGTLGCGFEERDFYLYDTGSKNKLMREYDYMQRQNIDCSLESELPLPLKIAAALRFPGQLLLDPLELASRLARYLNIREHTRITRLTPDGAEAGQHKIRARRVIVATHFPLPKLRGLYALKLYQKRSYVLALEGADDIGAAYEDLSEDGMYMRMYGQYLLLGGGDHRTGKRGGFDPLLAFRANHFMHTRIHTSWATQDTVSLDGMPYIGRLWKGSEPFLVATGFGGNGFVGSMIASKLLTDLALGRENPCAPVFSPSRSMISAQLFSNIAAAIGDYLIPTTRRCPHLGCALVWNSDECTWDCPCHGSRFTKCGELINGPAQHNLAARGEQK